MSDRERMIRQRLKDDFPHYAAKCLKIRTKDAGLQPLILNKAQLYIHARLEEQRREKGWVRAVLLKGRQQGASTLIEARFFHRVTHAFGLRAFILTHMQDATDNLFGMVDRYFENCPELVRPKLGTSNAKELHFSQLDSSYRAATAGSKGAGRSETIQLFHGSEVALWPNADDHLAGALQAVPLAAGTEVILESTALGIGNAFHKAWQDAESGRSDFIAIFVPWFWQPEYRRAPPAGFELTEEEREYKAAHGLDDQQISWRRAKIIELRGDDIKFKQEYPATSAEAFEQSGKHSFIRPKYVLRARKTILDPGVDEPLIIGVDLGGVTSEDVTEEEEQTPSDTDRSSIMRRRGKIFLDPETYHRVNAMALVGKLARIIDLEQPDRMFIDLGNGGHIVVANLRANGYGRIVMGVNFGGAATDPKLFLNKRAEMWDTMRVWFEEDELASIPDNDEFHADLVAVRRKMTSLHTKLVLESKVDMARRGVRSPDLGDGAAMTFAFPVASVKMRNRPAIIAQSSFNPFHG
jgi:hypothetical protein